MKIFFAALLVSFFFIVAPESHAQQKKGNLHPRDKYQEAIVDAMVAEESEICSTLIAIRPDNHYLSWSNGYVLVCTWTGYASSFHPGDTLSLSWGDTWVTAVPELKDWQKKHRNPKTDAVLRTKQLLGLPANANKTTFVEMWVKPADLFRPAYDNEIDDRTCGLSFPANATQEYIDWFDNNIIASYYPPRSPVTFPWTRLGYTYDWGNPKSEIGLSEFVIKKSSRVIVKSVTPNDAYLK
jgi:hypothetical protein